MKFTIFENTKHVEELKKIPYQFKAEHDAENKVSKITIYGVIGSSWYSESTSASDIDAALSEAGSNNIVIHLNSPGGDAFDGIAIYNRLMNYKQTTGAKITIHVDGWACSAASVIAMAADELIVGVGAMIMIHPASTGVWGTKVEFRKEADLLEKLESGIIDIYMTKAKVEREEIETMVNNTTWFSAEESIAIGFASSIEDTATPQVKTNNAKPDAEAYKNSVLARFKTLEPTTQQNILTQFKRNS